MESQEKSWPINSVADFRENWSGGMAIGAEWMGEAWERTARSIEMKRTVRGDGIGDVPGRRMVGRRGVLEETRLGEDE